MKKTYPQKFATEDRIFSHIHPGDRIFISTGCDFAEIAFVVRDDYQSKGLGTELFSYLTYIAKKQGLLGFTALVLLENQTMLHLIRKMGFDIEEKLDDGMYEIKMLFRKGSRSGTFRKEAVG